jgi:hypothetical protein
MCSVFHLGPLKKFLRCVCKLANDKSSHRSAPLPKGLPMICLKLHRFALVSCGVGQACGPAVRATVLLQAVAPDSVSLSYCHLLQSLSTSFAARFPRGTADTRSFGLPGSRWARTLGSPIGQCVDRESQDSGKLRWEHQIVDTRGHFESFRVVPGCISSTRSTSKCFCRFTFVRMSVDGIESIEVHIVDEHR